MLKYWGTLCCEILTLDQVNLTVPTSLVTGDVLDVRTDHITKLYSFNTLFKVLIQNRIKINIRKSSSQ